MNSKVLGILSMAIAIVLMICGFTLLNTNGKWFLMILIVWIAIEIAGALITQKKFKSHQSLSYSLHSIPENNVVMLKSRRRIILNTVILIIAGALLVWSLIK
ncbi:uncharacterized protein involved in exopolysaccharide biosynthesis [Scopulibacillus daqui]|uniref:Uncharacterized protein involved in exopolysaccharide biosynthesis n=1 Tax=Scopulibacillus daqui TaxID=1469162 RepID=A0ABS2PVJ6_9BACL|nr:hypothetical protein [Scopulibacillus daqui]MBM7644083.1 uncharacterized protein involved in exopolysaccharide biosynthesis [Scopulibacillus daqui]